MPTCPMCANTSPAEAWRYQQFTIFECPECQLQFISPMQSPPLDYYQEHYQQTMQSALADHVHPGFTYTLKKIAQVRQRYLTAVKPKAIDVGCGPGYLLWELQNMGLEAFGIDFNPDAVRVAAEHFHVRAEVKNVEELIKLQEHFDLALLIHVLEHVERPAELLRNVRQLLGPDGVLVVDLPNRERFSLRRSLRKGNFEWGEYPPHHLTFWSVAALRNALERCGYAVLECHPRPLGDEGQVELFLHRRLHLPRGTLTSVLAQVLRSIARALGLQGATIFAVARARA